MASPWPFTGRDELVRGVSELLAGGRSAAVVGNAGIGKSRLVEEVLERLPARHTVLRAGATRATSTIPFGALTGLNLLAGAPRGLPNVVGWAAEQVVSRATALPRGSFMILVADDVQLFDRASLQFVHLLLGRRNILILATMNTSFPLSEDVVALFGEGRLERVAISPLTVAETTLLLEAVLDGSVTAWTARKLADMCGGNLVYLRELVHAGRADGALALRSGVWTWDPDRPMVAERLVELVSARAAGGGPDVLRVLELLALGEPLGVATLSTLASSAALERAEDLGLVVIDRAGRRLGAQLAHPLYAEAMRSTMPVMRRRRLLASLVETVRESGARRREDILRLAVWHLDSGGREDPATLAAAARQAFALYDFPTAVRLVDSALEAGASGEDAAYLSMVLASADEFPRAIAATRRALARATSAVTRAALATVEAFHLSVGFGRLEEALACLADVCARLADHGADVGPRDERGRSGELGLASERELFAEIDRARDEVVVMRATILMFAGLVDSTRVVAHNRLGTAGKMPPDQRAHLQCAVAMVLPHAGATEAAEALARSILETSRTWLADRPYLAPFVLTALAWSRVVAGEPEAAMRELGTWHDLAPAGEWPLADGFLGLVRCWALRMQGQFAAALDIARDIAVRVRQARSGALGEAAHCLAALGRLPEAATALREAADSASPGIELTSYSRGIAAVQYAAMSGDLAAAESAAHALAAEAIGRGAYGIAIHALHELTRLSRPDIETLATVSELVEGRFAVMATRHAAALASADVDALADVAAGWKEAGLWPFAAEAWAQASTVLRARGSAGAVAAELRAREAAVYGDGLPTPALIVARAPALTRRQLHVARLAAQGMSNAMIAADLGIGERTVESHLASAFVKLGINDRRRLRDVFEG